MDIKEKIKRINLYRKLLHLFLLALTSTAGLTLATKVAKIFSYDMYWLAQASAVDTIFINL